MTSSPLPRPSRVSPSHTSTYLVANFIRTRMQPRIDKFASLNKSESPSELMRKAFRRRKISIRSASGRYKVLSSRSSLVAGLDGNSTSLPSDLATRIASNKWETKQAFSLAGVPHPAAQRFLEGELKAAKDFVANSGQTFAVKAERGRPSVGLSLGVQTERDLEAAWGAAIASSLDPAPHRGVLVEQYHQGLDVRVYVVGEFVASAVVRVPTYVIGDGRSTLGDLFAAAMEPRTRHAHLAEHIPRLSALPLGRWNLHEHSIVEAGVVQPLSEATSIRGGAITVDVTDELSEDTKRMAIDAAWSVPGLVVGGIDLLVPDLASDSGVVVLEVNVSANILPHTYPALGKPRDVAGAVADLMIRTSRPR